MRKAVSDQLSAVSRTGAGEGETEVLRIVEGKLARTVIKRLISLGLQRSEIDAAIIPLRTLQHRRSRREKLTVEESDRVLRVIRYFHWRSPSTEAGSGL
jgi:uncharacterized protein (DUF2384 family)